MLTRQGLEEYVSDCVIVLDHRVNQQISARRLRVVKYRGSTHGTNEYPFLIDENGFSVLPVTSLNLQQEVTTQRISSGIPRLDAMLGGKGYYRGSSVLISGAAGSGKTSFAAHFIDAACRRDERAIYFSFEESPNQIFRNMRSIGIDLERWVRKGLLQFQSRRPTMFGLEMHLVSMHKAIALFNPQVVVVDPINSFINEGNEGDVRTMLVRLMDFLKTRQITGLFTSLTSGGAPQEQTNVAVSSLIDTWLLLRDIEISGESNRGVYVLKSRGMAHSNQIREFLLTDRGVEILDVYVGPDSMLTGSARLAKEAQERSDQMLRLQEVERKRIELKSKRAMLETQITAMRAEFALQEAEMLKLIEQEQARETRIKDDRTDMAHSRQADVGPHAQKKKGKAK